MMKLCNLFCKKVVLRVEDKHLSIYTIMKFTSHVLSRSFESRKNLKLKSVEVHWSLLKSCYSLNNAEDRRIEWKMLIRPFGVVGGCRDVKTIQIMICFHFLFKIEFLNKFNKNRKKRTFWGGCSGKLGVIEWW